MCQLACQAFGDSYDREFAQFRTDHALDASITAAERPTVTLMRGEAPGALDAAENLLVERANMLRVYQRAGEAVRIVKLDTEQRSGGLTRHAGTVQLQPIIAVALTEEFDRLATWERLREGKDGPAQRRVDCPGRTAARIPLSGGIEATADAGGRDRGADQAMAAPQIIAEVSRVRGRPWLTTQGRIRFDLPAEAAP